MDNSLPNAVISKKPLAEAPGEVRGYFLPVSEAAAKACEDAGLVKGVDYDVVPPVANPPRLRILLDGIEVPVVAERSKCSPWIEEKLELLGGQIIGIMRRKGFFVPPFPHELDGRTVRVEHLDDDEAFNALCARNGDGVEFRSDGPPLPLPDPAPMSPEMPSEEPKINFREFL